MSRAEVSAKRASSSIVGAKLVVIKGGPHGINVSHAAEFNAALISFLRPTTNNQGSNA